MKLFPKCIYLQRFLRWFKHTSARIGKFLCSIIPTTLRFNSNDYQESEIIKTGILARNYVMNLVQDKNSDFSRHIENFIYTVLESPEKNPHIVSSNIREFISELKKYLLIELDSDLKNKSICNKVLSVEFYIVDSVFENLLQHLIVEPIYPYLQTLFANFYGQQGSIKQLTESIQIVKEMSISNLALTTNITVPSDVNIEIISHFIERMKNAYSPREKLENLLAAIATLFCSVRCSETGKVVKNLGADDFLPLLVWILARTNFNTAEIEAVYILGLLNPVLLNGEGGYYLTTLFSAIHILKSITPDAAEDTSTAEVHSQKVSKLKVVVPENSKCSKIFLIEPGTTTRQMCKIIAEDYKICNPQEYALYRLIEETECKLLDSENLTAKEILETLCFKRIQANNWDPFQKSYQK